MKYFFSFLSIVAVVGAIMYVANKYLNKVYAGVGKKYVVMEEEDEE